MRVFVFEYITGGGMLGRPLPPTLAEEGEMMLRALVVDLAEQPGIEVLTSRDARLPEPRLPARVHYVGKRGDFSGLWHGLLSDADAVWPIAPESEETLAWISESVVAAGKQLLNSGPSAVVMASSKLHTARRLAEGGLPVVPTYRPAQGLTGHSGHWVLKPDDGVGCTGSRIFESTEALYEYWRELHGAERYVAQPYLDGTSASLSLLCADGEGHLLATNLQQVIPEDGRFRSEGYVVNGWQEGRALGQSLARDIAAMVPDLWGYVGVDLILTSAGPKILEINPRLTTSYVGLRQAMGTNPARLVLDLLEPGRSVPREGDTRKAVAVHVPCRDGA